jgi:ubiquinone/menaquinone biosynthesis C-methylase UbiE
VTRRLLERMRGHGVLMATDLNEAMIAHGRSHISADPELLEWQTADATKLPFPDCSFDAVVCQFGLMFFLDKAAGIGEAFRVLRPGGPSSSVSGTRSLRQSRESPTRRSPPSSRPTRRRSTRCLQLHDPEPVRGSWRGRASDRSAGHTLK